MGIYSGTFSKARAQ